MPSSSNIFAVLAAPSTADLVAVPKVSCSKSSVTTEATLNSSTVSWTDLENFKVVAKKEKKVSGNKPKQIEASKADHVTKIGYATKKRGGKRGGRKPKATKVTVPSGPLPKIDFHKK